MKFSEVTVLKEINFMIKKWIFYASIALILAFISSGFKGSNSQVIDYSEDQLLQTFVLPSQYPQDYYKYQIVFTGYSFTGFKEAVAFKESQGNYRQVNRFGYMGKYQFGKDALSYLGIKNHSAFLADEKLQERAFERLLAVNKGKLKKEIEIFSGKEVGGVLVTESGILAAAHLGGSSSVKKFLYSNGKNLKRDGFGTSIASYMRKYAGYDTSSITAEE